MTEDAGWSLVTIIADDLKAMSQCAKRLSAGRTWITDIPAVITLPPIDKRRRSLPRPDARGAALAGKVAYTEKLIREIKEKMR